LLLLHFFFKNVDEQSSFFARLEISTVLAPFGNFYRFAPTKKKKKRRLNKLCFDEVKTLLGDHRVGLDHPRHREGLHWEGPDAAGDLQNMLQPHQSRICDTKI